MAKEFESKIEKKCLYCGESIAVSAKKCIHCDSFQDWKRHLSVGNSALALLVALASVITLSLPGIQTFISPPTSRITPVILSGEQSFIDIAVVNSGSIDGLILHISISVGSRDYNIDILPQDTVIKGRNTKTIRVDLSEPLSNYAAFTAERQISLSCSLNLVMVDMPANARRVEKLLVAKCNEFFVDR